MKMPWQCWGQEISAADRTNTRLYLINQKRILLHACVNSIDSVTGRERVHAIKNRVVRSLHGLRHHMLAGNAKQDHPNENKKIPSLTGEKDMETVKLLTESGFQHTITSGVVLVDFNAPWCGPCRFQEPIIKGIAEQFEDKAFVREVNVDENREIAIRLGIQSIPTLILFKNGKEIKRFIGLQTNEVLSRAIERALD